MTLPPMAKYKVQKVRISYKLFSSSTPQLPKLWTDTPYVAAYLNMEVVENGCSQ